LPGLWHSILWLTTEQERSNYVRMLIHGTPIVADMPADPDFRDRFWYWTGASGRKYIHSVYALEDCPPLPGAIFVAVRREGTMRIVVGIGRFTKDANQSLRGSELASLHSLGADEIHVHLLAKAPEVAAAVLEDLLQAYESDDGGDVPGFSDVGQRLLA
jgi:hypothetical protein